ncbi:hypothetical protein M1349_01170 [Patescibacteria group bacterium]|nr:hypothetical protein [Patescibacteria group bacterium]
MKKFIFGAIFSMFALAIIVVPAFAADKGFDEFGYNDSARIFNGTGESWSLAKGLPANYLGAYANDKLVMKWNAEWDRGNAEGWSNPPYAAWENNEWNGRVPGGSGEIWHYKIAWDQGCEDNDVPSTEATKGTGYCLWGPFAMLQSQGSGSDRVHVWDVLMKPAGYGAY